MMRALAIVASAAHPEAAWKFVRFVTTDTDAVAGFANLIGNVPTTKPAATSPLLELPPEFDTFLHVYEHEGSHYKPLNLLGATDQDALTRYLTQVQESVMTDEDIQAGLSGVAKQMDDQLERAG